MRMYSKRDLIEKFIEQETMGGKVNFVSDKNDPGGPTMYGIASNYHPLLEQKIKNKSLTYEEAVDYYDSVLLSDVYFNPKLGFDLNYYIVSLILSGQSKYMASLIQIGLNLLGHHVLIDGYIGPKTISAIADVSSDSEQLFDFVNFLIYCTDLAFSTANPAYKKGFVNRNVDNAIQIILNA